MQLFQINESEDSSKITIMSDTTCGKFHQRPITTAPTLPYVLHTSWPEGRLRMILHVGILTNTDN